MALKLRLIHPTSKLIFGHLIYPLQQSNDELVEESESRSMAQCSKLNRGITQGFYQMLEIIDRCILLKCMRSKGLIWLKDQVRTVASQYYHFYKIH